MSVLQQFISIAIGLSAGIIYGFSFFAQGFDPPKKQEKTSKDIRKRRFTSFFLFAFLRILLIGCLWYFVLRSSSTSIILVLLSFLASFWFVLIKKKARRYERF